MADLAKAAGVSKNTVSLALRNDKQIPPATRERIHSFARELGYCKNPVVGHLMAQLRTGAANNYKATMALLNLNEDEHAFVRHPTIPTYVLGCQRRASEQGYELDNFWLGNPELDGERLQRIFDSRGICGALAVGMMCQSSLSVRFFKIWENYPCVVAGVRTCDPALSFACVDYHDLALQAVKNILRLGYRRPALMLDAKIDLLIDGRLSAAFYIAQRHLTSSIRVPPFYIKSRSLEEEIRFRRWFDKHRPDVILTLYHTVHAWVRNIGLRVPEDLGLVQLEWRQDQVDWAGMKQHNDQVGEAAVDMLVSMLHNGEKGVPRWPRVTLIGSTWFDGRTVREMSPG